MAVKRVMKDVLCGLVVLNSEIADYGLHGISFLIEAA